MDKLLQKLEERKKESNYRTLSVSEGMVDFFSNDYLGLAKSKEILERIHKEQLGMSGNVNGSTGSRLLSGNSTYFEATESKLAGIFNSEKALLFNSGYSANMSLLSSVPQKGDTILYDELIHASLKEGARLSFAKRFSFRHNDIADLEQKISKAEGTCFVVVESVYSMDGDFAPLRQLALVCVRHNAYLIVDEAHSTGIWGAQGKGIVCELGLEDKVFARIYTFGKAMGIHGACIAGSSVLIDYLINFARPFIYTTALPPHGVASVNVVFDYLKNNEVLAQQLFLRIAYFKKTIDQYPEIKSALIESESAIQVLKYPGNNAVKRLSSNLRQQGYDVRPILSPTVKEGEERLRICLHVYNTENEIEGLVHSIKAGFTR